MGKPLSCLVSALLDGSSSDLHLEFGSSEQGLRSAPTGVSYLLSPGSLSSEMGWEFQKDTRVCAGNPAFLETLPTLMFLEHKFDFKKSCFLRPV